MEQNHITNCNCGILLRESGLNQIIENNIYNNNIDAYFVSCNNFWKTNYWGKPAIIKIIFGKMDLFRDDVNSELLISWFNIDWHPAKEPYEI